MRRPATCLMLLIFGSVAAHADGVYRDGIGARSVGRGGTNIAFSDNGQVLLNNPAGMSNISSRKLMGFGIDLLVTDLEYSDEENGRTSAHNNPFPVGQVSYLQQSSDGKWGIGFGVFSQAGFAATYDLNGPPTFAGPQTYKSLGALSRILTGASYRANERLTVGANVGVAVSHIELEGPYTLQGPNPFQGTPLLLDMQATGAAFSWSLGLQYDVSESTRVGLSYLGETNFSMGGSTKTAIPGLPTAKFDSELEISWPREVGVGVQHRLDARNTIAVDVLWINWQNSFDDLALHLSNPNDPTVAAVTGGPFTDRFPLDWSDSISVRLGYERALASGDQLRAGYVYHSNPIPSSTLSPFIQTTLEHAVSVGYGWNAAGLQIDAAYQFSFGDRQDVTTTAFVGGDFDNSSSWVSAHWFLFEVSRRTE